MWLDFPIWNFLLHNFVIFIILQKNRYTIGKSQFGCKLYSIIDRDYELIRRFKTTIASLHDSQVIWSENDEVAYRDRGDFEQNQNGMMQQWKE
jgi:hypothetical protein